MRVMMLSALLLAGCAGESKDTSAHDHDHDHHDDHGGHGDTDLPDDFDDTQEKLSQDGLSMVTYVTDSGTFPESVEFGVNISLLDPTDGSTLLADATVTEVDATMPSHGGHGMNVTAEVTENADGTFSASPIKLHMPGYWVLHVDFEVDGTADTTDFEIDCCD